MSTQTTTSGYMLLFRGTHWDNLLSPEEIQEVMSRWTAWFDRLSEQGNSSLTSRKKPTAPEATAIEWIDVLSEQSGSS